MFCLKRVIVDLFINLAFVDYYTVNIISNNSQNKIISCFTNYNFLLNVTVNKNSGVYSVV